jgi:hypothetical protein
MFHIQLPQQVDSNSIMKANFITSINQDTFGGVLLYHLQGKKDTPTSTQLLMIWGYKSNGLYSNVLLIEHENTLIWSEDELKRLYHVYDSRYKAYYDTDLFGRETWLLDDNTELHMSCNSWCKDFKIELSIFESETSTYPPRPLWIEPNR